MEEKAYKQIGESVIKQSRIGNGSVIDHDCVILKSEIGENVDIEKRNLIRDSVVGDMSYTGSDTGIMWAEVGKYCCISRMVDIGGNEHDYRAVSMMPLYRMENKLLGKLNQHPDEEKIVIGNDVWIGAGAQIVRKKGLKVGNGAVIGAGAVVTKSVPPYAIVAGVPAKVIGYRFMKEVIGLLEELKWWDWDKEKVAEELPFLTSDLSVEKLRELLAKSLEK